MRPDMLVNEPTVVNPSVMYVAELIGKESYNNNNNKDANSNNSIKGNNTGHVNKRARHARSNENTDIKMMAAANEQTEQY